MDIGCVTTVHISGTKMKFDAEYLEIIGDYLNQLEYFKQVKVLVAFLGGYAAMGLPELDKEITIYYVFAMNRGMKKERLSTTKLPIYAKGYNVRYFSGHLMKMRFLEIAHSPVVYVGDVEYCKRLSVLLRDLFSEPIVLSSYSSKRLSKQQTIYRIYKMLSCKWICEHHNMPPMNFDRLVEETVETDAMKTIIYKVVRKEANEKEIKSLITYLKEVKLPENKSNLVSRDDLECELYLLSLDMSKKYSGQIYGDADEQEQEVLE